MIKTLKAWLLGYYLFEVNGEYFLSYNKALTRRKSIAGYVYFRGWNIWYWLLHNEYGPWRGFFERVYYRGK